MAVKPPRVAFYAPLKPPGHPNPSGDRRVARLTLRALERAGFAPFLASPLRSWEGDGDAAAQERLFAAAEDERRRLKTALAADPPALWVTYHCYWKAPDLIGPQAAAALGVGYAVVEGARSSRRREGAWARFAAAADAALDAADVVFWMTARDLPALQAQRPERQRLIHLPPFTALGQPAERPISTAGPLRLATVAMMRAPDKLASYLALATGLSTAADVDWSLTIVGDGEAEDAVRAAFAPFGARVAFTGRINSRPELHAIYAEADLVVWPGVNEAYGMTYLEAQAMGRAVIAEDRPGVREVVAPACALVRPGDPGAFGAALRRFAQDRPALAEAGRAARRHMELRHGVKAAAIRLRAALAPLIRSP